MDDRPHIGVDPEMEPLFHLCSAIDRSMPASPRRLDELLACAVQTIDETTGPIVEKLIELHSSDARLGQYTWDQERTHVQIWLQVCVAAGVETRLGHLRWEQ